VDLGRIGNVRGELQELGKNNEKCSTQRKKKTAKFWIDRTKISAGLFSLCSCFFSPPMPCISSFHWECWCRSPIVAPIDNSSCWERLTQGILSWVLLTRFEPICPQTLPLSPFSCPNWLYPLQSWHPLSFLCSSFLEISHGFDPQWVWQLFSTRFTWYSRKRYVRRSLCTWIHD